MSGGLGRGKYDRSTTKEERFAERHERLLRAAAEVFSEEGASGANLAAITKRAGVGRRTFYDHFSDLDQCLEAVYEYAIDVVFRNVGGELRQVENPIRRLEIGIMGYLAIIARNGALATVVTRDIRGVGRPFTERRDAVFGRFAAIIMEGVAEACAMGLLSRPPDELTCYALVGAIETVALRYVGRRETKRIHEAAPALVELVLRAFR